MKDLNFKLWINEYGSDKKGLDWGVLFRGTCGDKSCSRGSGRGWDPYLDREARTPNLVEVGVMIDNKSKGYYNPDEETFVLSINASEALGDANKNLLIKQLVEKYKKDLNLKMGEILSNINLKQNKNFSQLNYIKNYISQNSLVILCKLA